MTKLDKLVHLWLDLDFTLFSPKKYERLEAKIFDVMHKYVADKLGKTYEEMSVRYFNLYAELESHSRVFKHLGLPPSTARDVYDSVNTAGSLEKDKHLMRMFKYFRKIELLYSVYSNSYSNSIDRTLERLGINPISFRFRLPGESFPKGLDGSEKDGFGHIIKLTRSLIPDLKPEQILFVGDRNLIDIKPAKAKGMTTALVWYDANRIKEVNEDRKDKGKSPLAPSFADYNLRTIYELKPLVEKLVR